MIALSALLEAVVWPEALRTFTSMSCGCMVTTRLFCPWSACVAWCSMRRMVGEKKVSRVMPCRVSTLTGLFSERAPKMKSARSSEMVILFFIAL